MYIITVMYLDEYEDVHLHVIEGDGYLDYINPLSCPVRVDRIMQKGLVFGREVDGLITRSGHTIPPGRIIKILWEDNLE